MARVLTVVWMLSGLVTQGLFVAAVTMSLVSQSLDVDFKLYGNKVIQMSKFCLFFVVPTDFVPRYLASWAAGT